MANEVRKITLTQLGSDAGPNFSVEYSVDCISYTASADCTNAFLPSVGSFAFCTVDENTTCIKLTSKGACTNAVIENPNVTSTTTSALTTTTTTLSPTTSTTLSPTTSTTLGPTTSTSTTCAPQAIAYELTQTATNSSVDYIDPYGQSRNINWISSATKRYIAARSITSATNVSTSSLGNAYGYICNTGSLDFCQQTITGVTASLSGINHVYYLSGSNGSPEFALVQNAFTDIAITECMVSGSLILPSPNTSSWDINYEGDCSCPTTTTTTAPIYGPFYSGQNEIDGGTNQGTACASSATWPFYADEPFASIGFGTTIYSDSAGQNIWIGNGSYYGISDTSFTTASKAMVVQSTGFVSGVVQCNITTSTTLAPTTTTTVAPTTSTTTVAPTTSTTTVYQPTIYTHGAVRGTCSDYCNTNYTITVLTNADNDYFSLTIGDTIYGQGGVAGYVAYSDVSTDTNTGPFRIAEIDSSGVVLSIEVCSGGSCVPL